ncbi:hypothetical protein DL93DRAFT_60450 [Clavulina sp. PMI_390]|nr:hypothetical protein DL93DRAFT_60450 [Clavulina sp. PMI_390]
MIGNRFAQHHPYFLAQTRYHLDQALMHVDRITHFLWASVVLACYFGGRRRVIESFVVVSSAARLAATCGLDYNPNMDGEDECLPSSYLLPPPRHTTEAADRIRLAHSIYLCDLSLVTLYSYPGTLKGNFIRAAEQPTAFSDGASIKEGGSKVGLLSLLKGTCSMAPIQSTERRRRNHLGALSTGSTANIINVEAISPGHKMCSCDKRKCLHRAQGRVQIIDRRLLSQYHGTIPSLSGSCDLSPSGDPNAIEPHLLYAHGTLYGSGLILYSLRAHDNAQARSQMLMCVRCIVDICDTFRKHSPMQKAQVSIPMVCYLRHVSIYWSIAADECQASHGECYSHYCWRITRIGSERKCQNFILVL